MQQNDSLADGQADRADELREPGGWPSARVMSFCCTPLLPSVGVSTWIKRGCQQNHRTLVNGHQVVITREAALATIREHVTRCVIKVGCDAWSARQTWTVRQRGGPNRPGVAGKVDGRHFQTQVGIPQGSVLSGLLCGLFYGHLEAHLLAKAVPLGVQRSALRHAACRWISLPFTAFHRGAAGARTLGQARPRHGAVRDGQGDATSYSCSPGRESLLQL